jgi:hypothetical protein
MEKKNEKIEKEKSAKDALLKEKLALEKIKSEIEIIHRKEVLRKELGVMNGEKVKSRVFES